MPVGHIYRNHVYSVECRNQQAHILESHCQPSLMDDTGPKCADRFAKSTNVFAHIDAIYNYNYNYNLNLCSGS